MINPRNDRGQKLQAVQNLEGVELFQKFFSLVLGLLVGFIYLDEDQSQVAEGDKIGDFWAHPAELAETIYHQVDRFETPPAYLLAVLHKF